jgi:hypothetical protein
MSSWLIPGRLALLWVLALLSASVTNRFVFAGAILLTLAVGYCEWRDHSRALALAARAKRVSGFVDERVNVLRPHVARLIAEADVMLREILDDGAAQTAKRRSYEKRIEDWRTRVGRFLTNDLRNPGLVSKCLPKMGAIEGNPIKFIHTRLERCRTNLADVQAQLTALVEESVRSATQATKKSKM